MPNYELRLSIVVKAVNQEAAENVGSRLVDRLERSADTEHAVVTSVERLAD